MVSPKFFLLPSFTVPTVHRSKKLNAQGPARARGEEAREGPQVGIRPLDVHGVQDPLGAKQARLVLFAKKKGRLFFDGFPTTFSRISFQNLSNCYMKKSQHFSQNGWRVRTNRLSTIFVPIGRAIKSG